MPVVMVMAWVIQKPSGMAISLAHAVAAEEIETSRGGADSIVIMASPDLHDEREDANTDAGESARRSRHCWRDIG